MGFNSAFKALQMYSYPESLSLEFTSDSIEQLSHHLEICEFFKNYYFIFVSHLKFVVFSSCKTLFGWYSTIAVTRKRW